MTTDKEMFNRCNCLCMVEDEDKIWFCSDNQKALCEIDKATREVKVLAEFDTEILQYDFFEESVHLYTSIQKIKDKLILVPWLADKIAIYDLKKDKIQYIDFADRIGGRKHVYCNCNFYNSFVYKNYVYMLPETYHAILILDINTNKIEYLSECITVIENRMERDVCGAYLGDVINIENIAWFSSCCTNLMIKLNLDTNRFEYHEVVSDISGMGAIAYDGESFWLSGWENNFEKIVQWKPEDGILKMIKLFENVDQKWCPVHSIFCYKNKLLIFPFFDSVVYEVDIKTGKSSQKFEAYLGRDSFFATNCATRNGNFIRFVGRNDCLWYEYNLETKKNEDYEICLSLEDISNRWDKEFEIQRKSKNYFIERKIPLEIYLRCNIMGLRRKHSDIGKNILSKVYTKEL